MKTLRSSWFPLLLGLVTLVVALSSVLSSTQEEAPVIPGEASWQAPDINLVPATPAGDMIRYGRELITNTAYYLGPRGTVAQLTNGMNCQNCHVDAGTRLFGSPFATVSTTYPKYRDRSGRVESIQFRVNECMERSLDGKPLDSLSREMQSMVAYFKWLGKTLAHDAKIPGLVNVEIPYLSRAADPEKGRIVFEGRCQNCHGSHGQGVLEENGTAYRYPPLWGEHSYNVSAGMYRLLRLAAFVKYNMPYTAIAIGPQLSDEEAWDVAAYINSQPRPEKRFEYDWPVPSTKPVDYPFGPYTDGFSEVQHKYGPYLPIRKAKEEIKK